MNSSAALIIAGIAALAAVAAAIVGPIVTYKITTLQIRATTASAGRKKWIEVFRENLSEMIAYLAIFKLNYELGDFKEVSSNQYATTLIQLMAKVELLLSDIDEDCLELSTEITKSIKMMEQPEIDMKEKLSLFSACLGKIINLGSKIIFKEWELIKKGK